MRRPTSALTTAILGTALMVPDLPAQQMPPAGSATAPGMPNTVSPTMLARGSRYLLRNGWDYITYQEYERALAFFREAEVRKAELNKDELQSLNQGIARAQAGMREPSNTTRSYAKSGRPRPGALAFGPKGTPAKPRQPARPSSAPAPATEPEPIQLASDGGASMPPASASAIPTSLPPEMPATLPVRDRDRTPGQAAAPEPIPASLPESAMQAAPPAMAASPGEPSPLPASPSEAPAEFPEPTAVPPALLGAPTMPPSSPPGPATLPAPTMTPPPAEVAPQPAPPQMPEPLALATAPAPVPAPEPSQVPPANSVRKAQEKFLAAAPPLPTPDLDPEPLPTFAAEPAAPAPPDPATRPAKAVGAVMRPDSPTPNAATPPPDLSGTSIDLELPPLPEAPSMPPVAPVAPPTPAAEPPATLTPGPSTSPMSPESLPPLPDEMTDGPMRPAPALAPLPTPSPDTLPPLPDHFSPNPTPEPAPMPAPEPAPMPAAAPEVPPGPGGMPAAAPPPAPAPTNVAPTRIASARSPSDDLVPSRGEGMTSSLSPELQRQVEQIAQREEDNLRNAQPEATTSASAIPSTRLEISRAPSPTEARPIRAIPVPEEFVPLPPRDWSPNRKYWSAAATCHLPLYFQDAALERYGNTTEGYAGRFGRCFTYPLDDPKQSNQRNQILQPIFSAGLFAAQIALWPYNLIVDPPWEAEYDLGYYRPGDLVPTDTYYLPHTGVGPPLRGKSY